MVVTRREYNRLLWRQAVAGMGLWAHLGFVGVALVAAGLLYLRAPSAFQADLARNVAISLGVAVVLEVVWLFLRRFLSAPYELYTKQSRTTDPDERRKLLRTFEKRLYDEEVHFIHTLAWHRIVPHLSKVRGWTITPSHFLNQQLDGVWLAE